ncbi:MAG TPA: hypothetical protein PLN31_02110 [Azoarcus taiwanensis]|nr:hypothetical protein [Azoarcus taiwanensis]
MKTLILITAFTTLAGLAGQTLAADNAGSRVAHYQALHSETIEEAVANLRDSNRKLAALLAGDVTDHDMQDIHSLAYTLEDTLQRLIDELGLLHDTVADMHWATEGLKRDAVIDYGEAYLDGVRKIIE